MPEKFKLKHIPSLFKETYHEWLDDEPFDLSAIVAYYAIFSMPALIIIIIMIAGSVFGQDAVENQLSGHMGAIIGKDAAAQIQKMVAQAYNRDNKGLALAAGMATLLFGATGVFVALQKSLNRVWEVRADPKKSGFKSLLKTRATSFGIILAIGFLLLISLLLTAGLTAISSWVMKLMPDFVLYLFYLIDFAMTLSIITLLFAMLYKFLPDVIIEWKSVWVGSAITAFLFVLGKFGMATYFALARPASTYGAAGSIILVLLWVSYSCLILFFGAEFTQVYAKRYGQSIEPNKNAIRIEDNYEVLKANILREEKEKLERNKGGETTEL